MEEHLPYTTAFLAILFTAKNLLLTLANYLFGRGTQLRNLAAKYKDRLYELNKLSLQYPDVASAFQAYEHPQEPTPSASPEPVAIDAAARSQAEMLEARLNAQMYAYVRFRINFYEEIYYATQDGRLKALEDSSRWRSYIDSRLEHRLVKEAIQSDSDIYAREFAKYALAPRPNTDSSDGAGTGRQSPISRAGKLKAIGEAPIVDKWAPQIQAHKIELIERVRKWGKLQPAIYDCCAAPGDTDEHRKALLADCLREDSNDWSWWAEYFEQRSHHGAKR